LAAAELSSERRARTLLSLLTTEDRPFDRAADVATRVGWYGMARLAAQLRAALDPEVGSDSR
jgi:hypothetical protein